MYAPDTYPRTYTPWTYTPQDTYPQDIYPQEIYPQSFEMPYLAHASCVDYIVHIKKTIYFPGIAFICNEDAGKLSHICCEEGFSPHNCSGSIYPQSFEMPYLAHASCVDYIVHIKKTIYFPGIALTVMKMQ